MRDDRSVLQTAYSLDGVVEELLYVAGPVLVGVLVLAAPAFLAVAPMFMGSVAARRPAAARPATGGHNGQVLTEDEFDDLCRHLYRSLRDASVNPEAAFDLSADILRRYPADEEAAQVATLALEDADPAVLAAAVRTLLNSRFDPGFDEEPQWLAALEEALQIVKADLRACGLPDTVRLYRWEGSSNTAVYAWAANSTGGGIYPQAGKDPVTALVEVADDTQDAVMHSIWGAWPQCPKHGLGVHARQHNGAAVWWCRIGSHVVAQIGQWPRHPA